MAMCPHCLTQKPFFANYCPNCTHRVGFLYQCAAQIAFLVGIGIGFIIIAGVADGIWQFLFNR